MAYGPLPAWSSSGRIFHPAEKKDILGQCFRGITQNSRSRLPGLDREFVMCLAVNLHFSEQSVPRNRFEIYH